MILHLLLPSRNNDRKKQDNILKAFPHKLEGEPFKESANVAYVEKTDTGEGKVQILSGEGTASCKGGTLKVSIPKPQHYLFLKIKL